MLVSYSLSPKENISNLVGKILAGHFYGTVLFDLAEPFVLQNATAIRELVSSHPCWLRIPVADDRVIDSWFDAGVRKIVLPPSEKTSVVEQFDPARFVFEEVETVTSLPVAEAAVNSGQLVSIDQSFDKQQMAEFLVSTLRSDRSDGLIPTVVADEFGVALGLVYSNQESIQASLESGKGVYWSRSRNELWEKGKTSGASQSLIRIDPDCDRDALRFTVRQSGKGFCHLDRRNCFSDLETDFGSLFRHLENKIELAESESYTRRLLEDKALRHAKIREEASELCEATDASEVTWESADLFYFCMVNLIANGVDLPNVVGELIRRTQKVTRRPGNAKQSFIGKTQEQDD